MLKMLAILVLAICAGVLLWILSMAGMARLLALRGWPNSPPNTMLPAWGISIIFVTCAVFFGAFSALMAWGMSTASSDPTSTDWLWLTVLVLFSFVPGIIFLEYWNRRAVWTPQELTMRRLLRRPETRRWKDVARIERNLMMGSWQVRFHDGSKFNFSHLNYGAEELLSAFKRHLREEN